MSRHGFARDHEFTLPEQTDDSIASELQETQATLDCCLFPFFPQVCRRIMKNGFSAAFRVENTGGQPMPFCIGHAPLFAVPLAPAGGLRITRWYLMIRKRHRCVCFPVMCVWNFPDFPCRLFGQTAIRKPPFVCPEPWHGCAAWINKTGNFTDKPGCIVLFSGESKTFSYTVCVK